MDFTKVTKNISVALNPEEVRKLIVLKEKKIKTIEIFRRGLHEYIRDVEKNEKI